MNAAGKITSKALSLFVVILCIALYPYPSYAESFSISLKLGKNLISIPLIPQDTSLPQVLQSIDGLYTDVWGIDSSDAYDPWKHYRPDLIQYSDLNAVKYGGGYYIIVTQDCILTVTGTRPVQNYTFTLNPGFNVLGWPFPYTELIDTALLDYTSPPLQFGTDYNQVSRVNPITKEQEDYYDEPATDDFDTFEPGKAYYINSSKTQPVEVTFSIIPQVKITSHNNNGSVSLSPIDISGTIDDPNTVVTVNSLPAVVTGSAFTANGITLTEGSNLITAEAVNTAGNTNYDYITLYLDSQPPTIQITTPSNGEIINSSPITVSGAIDDANAFVDVNGVFAENTAGVFTAVGLDLRLGLNTITASAYDQAGNMAQHTITVTSTVTSDYNITKITPDIYEYDPTTIIAGSQVPLTVRLQIDGSLAQNEPVQFLITQGNGSMVQSTINTDINGQATAVLNTDIDASATNLIDAFAQAYPLEKVTFHIDTKEGPPAQLIKITDDSVIPAPGADIDLVVRLDDSNNNPIPDEEITFQVISGPGSLSSTSDITKDYGDARVVLTTSSTPSTSCTIQAQSIANPVLTVDFVVVTSGSLVITVNDIDTVVESNNSQIQDIMSDIHVTSNAPWLAPATELKIWRKGNKQKVQEISPEPGIYIKSAATQTATPVGIDREIVAYDSTTNVYTIKAKTTGQVEEYPHEISYVDYSKGVVTKVEHYTQDDQGYITKYIKTTSGYILVTGAWVFQTLEETWSSNMTDITYTTTSTYSNIVINSGIPDSVFE